MAFDHMATIVHAVPPIKNPMNAAVSDAFAADIPDSPPPALVYCTPAQNNPIIPTTILSLEKKVIILFTHTTIDQLFAVAEKSNISLV